MTLEMSYLLMVLPSRPLTRPREEPLVRLPSEVAVDGRLGDWSRLASSSPLASSLLKFEPSLSVVSVETGGRSEACPHIHQ